MRLTPSWRCGPYIPCSDWTAADRFAANLTALSTLGPPLRRSARTYGYAYFFCWRPEAIVATPARGDGAARERASSARQSGGADRLEHGGRGVLALFAPPRWLAR